MAFPFIRKYNDKIYFFGGEIDASLVENETFVGCTDLALECEITIKN